MQKLTLAIITSILVVSQASAAEKLTPFVDAKTKLYGYKNSKGKVVVPAQFQMAHTADEGEELYPVIKGGSFCRIDAKGNLRFASVFFDNAWDYYEDGLSRFLLKDKVGYHDKKGNVIIKPEYDFAGPFRNGHALVCNGCWGAYPDPRFAPLSSNGGHRPIKEQYMDVTGGKWGAINIKGQVVVPLEYDDSSAVYNLVHREKK